MTSGAEYSVQEDDGIDFFVHRGVRVEYRPNADNPDEPFSVEDDLAWAAGLSSNNELGDVVASELERTRGAEFSARTSFDCEYSFFLAYAQDAEAAVAVADVVADLAASTGLDLATADPSEAESTLARRILDLGERLTLAGEAADHSHPEVRLRTREAVERLLEDAGRMLLKDLQDYADDADNTTSSNASG